MTKGFADIHQHLVYGVDDGPNTFRKTCAMLQMAKQNQVNRIIATPHVVPGVQDFDRDSFMKKLERTRSFCEHLELGIEIFPGAEIFYTEQTCKFLLEDRVPTLAGTGYVLVEFSPDVSYQQVQAAVENLSRDGYIPVIAHVERYRCVVSKPRSAYELKERFNVRYQVNCSTVIHGKGVLVNRFCKKLLSDGLIDAVATDAHNVDTRPIRMMEAYKVLEDQCGAAYAERLTGLDGGLVFSCPRS